MFLVLTLSIGFGTLTVIVGVSPDSVDVVLGPGDSSIIDKDVSAPCTGSYYKLLMSLIQIQGKWMVAAV